jgi:hypothetical protein
MPGLLVAPSRTVRPMITYNGFKPGESRTTTWKSKPKDAGHTIVSMTTFWNGGAFRFHYTLKCECGRTFRTKSGSTASLFYRYNAHI